MKVLLATDFHVGFKPKSHVTTASAQRWAGASLQQARDVSLKGESRIMLGDMFDKYSNPESVIQAGREIVGCYGLVLSGNHDVHNIEGAVGSLQLIADERVHFTHEHDSCVTHVFHGDSAEFTALCHYYTQAQFEQALRKACDKVSVHPSPKYLLLHCNVGNGYEEVTEGSASLYLTDELRELAEGAFDRILVGHEHNARKVSEKTQILGNHFPLSFGQMTDKFVWWLDTETNELAPEKVWDSKQFASVPYSALAGMDKSGLQFIEVTGTVTAEEHASLLKEIVKTWKECDWLLGIRNKTTVHTAADAKPISRTMNFAELLRGQIEAAGYKDLLDELA